MSVKVQGLAARAQEMECVDRLTGLILQDPTGQTQQISMGGTDKAGDADYIAVKCSFGTPFIIEATIDTEEGAGAATTVLTALAAGGSDVFPVYSSTADALTTGSPFRFKVLDCHVVMLDESAGSAADTIQLMNVAADGTTETAITNAMSLNAADDALVRCATIDQDACVIDLTENLRFDVVLANSGNHATCVKVVVTCMRCVAAE